MQIKHIRFLNEKAYNRKRKEILETYLILQIRDSSVIDQSRFSVDLQVTFKFTQYVKGILWKKEEFFFQ